MGHDGSMTGLACPESMETSGEADKDLVLRAREGDREAFAEIVRTYQRRIYAVAMRMTRRHEVADDITQDTFVRAYRNLGRFEIGRPLRPWLTRIAVNLAINYLNGIAKREQPLYTEDSPGGPGRSEEARASRQERLDSNPERALESEELALDSRTGGVAAPARAANGVPAESRRGDALRRDREAPRDLRGHGDVPALARPRSVEIDARGARGTDSQSRRILVTDCAEIRLLVEKLADVEATAAEKLAAEAHLERCPSCRSHVEFLASLSAESRSLRFPEPPESYWEHLPRRVLARIDSEDRRPSGIWKILLAPSVLRFSALGATLVLVTALGLSVLRERPVAPAPAAPAPAPAAPAREPEAPAPAEPIDSPPMARDEAAAAAAGAETLPEARKSEPASPSKEDSQAPPPGASPEVAVSLATEVQETEVQREGIPPAGDLGAPEERGGSGERRPGAVEGGARRACTRGDRGLRCPSPDGCIARFPSGGQRRPLRARALLVRAFRTGGDGRAPHARDRRRPGVSRGGERRFQSRGDPREAPQNQAGLAVPPPEGRLFQTRN